MQRRANLTSGLGNRVKLVRIKYFLQDRIFCVVGAGSRVSPQANFVTVCRVGPASVRLAEPVLGGPTRPVINTVLWPLEFFVCLKNVFFYLHQEKVLCYTQFKIYSTLKTHILIKSINFCEKSFKQSKRTFKSVKKKIIKHNCQKKFFVCLEEPMAQMSM